MEKETVLAKIRVSMGFSDITINWLKRIESYNFLFAVEVDTSFFSENRNLWEEILVSSSESIIHDYFLKLGLPKEKLPSVKVYESYSGSWIIEAALIMSATIGSAYAILKGISELPKIADGLTELKDRLKKEFSREASEKAYRNLKFYSYRYKIPPHKIPPPPSKQIIFADLILDVRPLLSLSPSIMKSHKIHINVAISRNAFTLENLGQETMRDIRIGIFKSFSKIDAWSYADSYMGIIDILSPQQTITKDIADFRNSKGQPLDLSNSSPLYVDCWVQDTHGIYLFMFYLED